MIYRPLLIGPKLESPPELYDRVVHKVLVVFLAKAVTFIDANLVPHGYVA